MKFQTRIAILGAIIGAILLTVKILDFGILRTRHVEILDADYLDPKDSLPDEDGKIFMKRIKPRSSDELNPRAEKPKHTAEDERKETERAELIEKRNNDANQRAILDSLLGLYAVDWTYTFPSPHTAWVKAASWVTSRRVTPDRAPELGGVLHALGHARVTGADVLPRGTQLKLSLTLEGGQRAVFKPRWYSREYIVTGKPYDGADRHNGEIAAFHLQRLLGLHRAPLAVGRVLDLDTEVLPVATARLNQTFFRRRGNTCFYGRCYYCKSPADGVCAQGSRLEGAMVLWLPKPYSSLQKKVHPWIRQYKGSAKARWEIDPYYCAEVRKRDPAYTHLDGPRMLDIADTAVLDYLIGNADRHHYEVFKEFNDSMLVLFDSAKSFGDPHHDEHSILAPLYQCCRLRQTASGETGTGLVARYADKRVVAVVHVHGVPLRLDIRARCAYLEDPDDPMSDEEVKTLMRAGAVPQVLRVRRLKQKGSQDTEPTLVTLADIRQEMLEQAMFAVPVQFPGIGDYEGQISVDTYYY